MCVHMYVCAPMSIYFIETERYIRIKYLMCPWWSNKQGGVIATHLNIHFGGFFFLPCLFHRGLPTNSNLLCDTTKVFTSQSGG